LRAEAAPVLVCTAGDFYGTADVYNESKSHFVARMMGVLGYDAIGIGEMDLNFGLASLVADARQYRLPIVCANLKAKSDSLRVAADGPAGAAAQRMGTAFPPYRIVTRAGARFGFVGVLSPATKVRGARTQVESLTYELTDALEAARTAVADLRPQCDVLIVLAHMDEAEARGLAEKVSGIDMIVLGHDPGGKPLGEPITLGGVRLLRASAQGQYIGQLDVRLGNDHRVADARNRMHVLSAEYPDDPDMAKRLNQFDEENRMIQKELFAKEQLKGASDDSSNQRYLGLGTCQSCHVEEFNVYAGTGHARAYATLASEFVHRDTNCVGCHVTGYGQAGGFQGVRLRGAMVDLVDVQCEACHGPGAEHSRDGSYRRAARESCVRCHTPNDDPDFNFDEDWPKIAH
jgi:2',3'-cyclic-nucleotide 2'-phosphodiesterase (5'-nucleotidase family)